jgi:uncharacterized phage protein gp47/JayE
MKELDLLRYGHIVTVDTVAEVMISIKTDITVDGTITKEKAQEQIIEAVNTYLLELRKTWEENDSLIIRKAQIETIILNISGVIDVSNTSINNQTGNITLDTNDIPKLEEVVIV